MSDFINSTVNTKIYNMLQDQNQIITIRNKEVIVTNIGTIVSGDTNSCLLTFEINRFQDGIDLNDKKIRFIYKNSNGTFDDIAVNVKYNDNIIRFSWLLPYSLTQPGGNVIASIEFYGYIEYNEEYSYKTKNFKLSVEKSLGVNGESDESYNNWTIRIESDIETIQNKIDRIEKEVQSIYVPTKLSEMDDDSEHRTVSDLQINAWNSVQKNVQADWDVVDTTSEAYIKNKPTIPKVTNDLTEELKQSYDNAVTNSHVHSNKSVIDDITAEKVNSWDNKSDFDGNYTSLQGVPQDLATKQYIDEKVQDKISMSDLADVAISGSYNDLQNKPTSLPASDVYQWAKQSQKPSYTAEEVGALPDTTQIPEVSNKLDKPAIPPNAAGKVLRVLSVNEDGTFTCEWADAPSGGGAVDDVQVNGASVVEDGVANIPIASDNTFGTVKTKHNYGIQCENTTGALFIRRATESEINNHLHQWGCIVPANLDYAVKAAMTDGKGAAWTADEKAAARERMGFSNYELVLDYTTTADDESSSDVRINFEKTDYTKLYIIFDESGIEGTTYSSVRFGLIDQTQLVGNRSLANTCPAFKTSNKWKTFKCELLKGFGWIYQATSEVQLYGYTSTSNVGQVQLASISGIGGITWYGTMYAGTNIKVWGFR